MTKIPALHTSTATRRFFLALRALVISAAVLCAWRPAQGVTTFGDIDITPEPTASVESYHGYAEYRFSVRNHSRRGAHTVRIVMPNPYGGLLGQISRSVRVGPGSTLAVSLLQPPLPFTPSGSIVFIDGQRQRDKIFLRTAGHADRYYMYSSGRTSILVSRSVSGDLNAILNGTSSTSPSRRPVSSRFARSELPVTNWSSNWLGYSRYDGIVVTSEDMGNMPPEVRTAILRYTECGGSLLVLGAWSVPETWRPWKGTQTDLETYYVGFGECLVSPESDPDRLSESQWQYISGTWSRTLRPWSRIRDVSEAHGAFAVVKNLKVPVRGMFIMMLLFAVIIGPVNLIVLSRKGKRIWMLWTVPAISFLTCAAVSAYSLLAEGLGAHARTEGLTILDEGSHRATTIGLTAFYSPLTPGEGLHFGYETELTPEVRSEYGDWDRQTADRGLDWTYDQHLAKAWVTARVPAHFMLRKSDVRRERVAVRAGAGGSLGVVNGLGADIRWLWLADENGTIYSAGNITAGAEAALSRAAGVGRAGGTVDTLRNAFTSGWITKIASFATHPERFLRPGCYIAVLDETPFIEKGLKKVKVRQSRSIVYGILKRDMDEG